MRYVKCVNNQPFINFDDQQGGQDSLFGITIGQVYKVIPDSNADRLGMVRIIDGTYGEPGSEHGYLYPADYFEPF